MVLRYLETIRIALDPSAGITAVSFSSHGTYLAAAALDGKVRIWSVDKGKLVYVFSGAVEILSLKWAGTSEDAVLCGLKDGTICCLSMTRKFDMQIMGFWAHSYPVEYLAVNNDLLASGAHEEVRIWKLNGDNWKLNSYAFIMLATLPSPPKTSFNRVLDVVVTSIHWLGQTGDRQQLLVTYLNHGVHIFDGATWEPIRSVPIPGQIADSSVSNDGKYIAISNVITGFDVYLVETGAAICSLGHTVSEYRKIPVLFIHNAVAVLGGNLHGDVHLWDVGSGRKLHSLIHPKEDQILALAAHYESTSDTFLIATGTIKGAQSTVVLWKAEELGQHEEPARQGVNWLAYVRMAFVATLFTIPAAVGTFIVFA